MSSARADDAPAPAAAAPANTDSHDGSYGVGISFGAQLRNSGIGDELSLDSLLQGIKAGLAGASPSPADHERVTALLRAVQEKLLTRNEAAAKDFLVKNATQPGIVTTLDGLQYRIVAAGDTKAASPKPTDQVTVNYRGQLLDGTEFDSSYKRGQPAIFTVGGVIKGWSEALQLMKPGAKWELYVPSELAYGAYAPPGSGIQPGSLLHFQVELLKVTAPKLPSGGQAGSASSKPPKPRSAAPAGSATPPSGH